MKQLEYQKIKNLGLFQKTLEICSNSDFKFYQDGEKIICKINNEIVFEDGTIKDVEEFLMQFINEE